MKTQLVTFALTVIIGLLVWNTYLGLSNRSSLAAQERQTCEIQVRGLAAQAYLTRATVDLGALASPVFHHAAQSPAANRLREQYRQDLARYDAIEARQPKHRHCS